MKRFFCIVLVIGLLVGCSKTANEKNPNSNNNEVLKITKKEDEKIKVFLYSLIREHGGLKDFSFTKEVKGYEDAKYNGYSIKLYSNYENSSGILTISLSENYKPISILYESESEFNSTDINRFLEIESSVFNNKLSDESKNIENMSFDENSNIDLVYNNIAIKITKSENKTLYSAENTSIKKE